jgi:hypothetical protein
VVRSPSNVRKVTEMRQYLLSIYQPDGDLPPPEVLEPVMRDVDAVDAELRAAGSTASCPPSLRALASHPDAGAEAIRASSLGAP